ncbi:MAG: hypothetical protein ACO1SV_24885 [Fimbriimonas sp.]
MSKRVTPSELMEIRKRLSATYPPISPRILESWIADWNTALERIHYAKSGTFTIAESLSALVKLRGAVKVRRNLFEMSRPDIERVWGEDVAKGLRAYHAIDERSDGFDFLFAAIDGNDQYMTGVVTVLRMEHHENR